MPCGNFFLGVPRPRSSSSSPAALARLSSVIFIYEAPALVPLIPAATLFARFYPIVRIFISVCSALPPLVAAPPPLFSLPLNYSLLFPHARPCPPPKTTTPAPIDFLHTAASLRSSVRSLRFDRPTRCNPSCLRQGKPSARPCTLQLAPI